MVGPGCGGKQVEKGSGLEGTETKTPVGKSWVMKTLTLEDVPEKHDCVRAAGRDHGKEVMAHPKR